MQHFCQVTLCLHHCEPPSQPTLWLQLQEYNDTMLTVYMASVTKGLSAVHDVIEKFNVAFDRSGPRQRGGV